MILGPAAGKRHVRLAPPRRDIILSPPGRLPQSEKGVPFPAAAERPDDLLKESPAWHLGPTE